MKCRSCPHCHQPIPVDQGFSFDERLNLICGKCGRIAYPISAVDEIKTSQIVMLQPYKQVSYRQEVKHGE